MDNIPEELLLVILNGFSLSDFVPVTQVCKNYYRILSSPSTLLLQARRWKFPNKKPCSLRDLYYLYHNYNYTDQSAKIMHKTRIYKVIKDKYLKKYSSWYIPRNLIMRMDDSKKRKSILLLLTKCGNENYLEDNRFNLKYAPHRKMRIEYMAINDYAYQPSNPVMNARYLLRAKAIKNVNEKLKALPDPTLVLELAIQKGCIEIVSQYPLPEKALFYAVKSRSREMFDYVLINNSVVITPKIIKTVIRKEFYYALGKLLPHFSDEQMKLAAYYSAYFDDPEAYNIIGYKIDVDTTRRLHFQLNVH